VDFYIKEDKMAKKAKRLCKWKEEDITKKFDEFVDIVRIPTFVCKKCGRVAAKKKWLHKPSELK
jgi:hypothetical protein